jgi:UDP-N-acetylglucosamine kinase
MDDEEIIAEAYKWIKQNSSKLIESTAGSYDDPQEGRVSVFMAGAPGAGKTEFSKCLLNNVFGPKTKLIVRIDPDQIRMQIPSYIPGKAELFNRATNKGVEILIDHCFDRIKNKSFLLDGTLSSYDVATKNIDRALDRNRKVIIYYFYKDPLASWEFTQKREWVEGRNIPKESFVEQYFGSMETINQLKKHYKSKIQVDLVQLSSPRPDKPLMTDYKFDFNITNVDGYIKKRYSNIELLQNL